MGLGNQFTSNPKRFLLGGIGALAVIALIIAGYYWYTTTRTTPYALSKETKDIYSEAILAAYREKDPTEAIEKLDVEIARVNAISVKTKADLYAEAKLKIYKGDLLIGSGKTQEGIKLLSEVYGNTVYDLSTRNEALLVVLSRSLQGLGEGSMNPQVIDYLVFRDPVLGASATTTLSMDAPEPIRIYFAFIAGFSKIVGDTYSPKSYLLAESYLLRLYTQVIDYTQGANESYGLLHSDIEQFTSDLDLVITNLASEGAPYEEFIPVSLYNVGLAHEFFIQEDPSTRINKLTEIRQKIIQYSGLHPDDAYRARQFEDALSVRLVCRLVDQAKFDAAQINKAQLKTMLDPLFQTASSQGVLPIPCMEQFAFIAKNIDTRFAPYTK